ncbi:MAG: hypothetical protein KF862_28185 [Chitinophagaceae bacterium]|nr:hypothetical protein [Chitinophagaceae bacterium]
MKFELSLSTLLVFIVPGTVTLVGLLLFVPYETIKSFIDKAYSNDKIDIILLFILAIFILGAIIEMLRPVTIGYIIEECVKDKMEDYLTKITKDNLDIFNMLTDQTQVYYKLNANFLLSTALLLTCGIFNHEIIPCSFYIIVSLFIVFEIIATVSARKSVIYVMNKFYTSN